MPTTNFRRGLAAALFILQFAYFQYYYHLLRISLSPRGFFVLILSLALMIAISTKIKTWPGIISLWVFNLASSLYLLSNFAYTLTFKTILVPTASQIQATDGRLITFLLPYLDLIPGYLYPISLVLLVLTCFGNYAFLALNKMNEVKPLFSLNVDSQFKKTSASPLIMLTAISLFLSLLSLKLFPASTWWDQSVYISDLGVHGFLGSELANAFVFAGDKLFNPAATLAVEPTTISATEAEKLPELTKSEESQALLKKLGESTKGPINTVSPKKYMRPNIIIYQMESIQEWPTEITPNPLENVTRIQNDNVSVGNFYSNSCDTVNAEFSTLCSTYPDAYAPINYDHKNNNFYCLPQVLHEKLNYDTALFHSGDIEFYDRNVLAPKWGFEQKYFNNYFKQKEPDDQVIDALVGKIKNTDGNPFFGYLIGYTNHSPHNQELIDYYNDNFHSNIAPFAGEIPKTISEAVEVNEQTLRVHLTFIDYVDKSVKHLFDQLEKEGLLDNTIVIGFGDHRYYNFFSENKLIDFYHYNRIPFFMYVPERLKAQVQPVASNIDIAPTILDLLNIEKPKNFIGTSIFSADHPQNVVNKCLSRVEYAAPGIILRGNVRSGQYNSLLQPDNFTTEQLDQATGYLKSIIEKTDEVLKENK